MTDEDKIARLEARINELELFLNRFDSYKEYKKKLQPALPARKTTQKTTKGSRLPEDWQPADYLVEWARKEFQHVDLALETDKFIDYWLSRADRGAIKLSWERTFRNWIRQASSNYRKINGTHKQVPGLDFNEAVRTSFD